MNDIRADARIIAMATSLAQHANRPAWVKPINHAAAILTIRRYRARQSSRQSVEQRGNQNDYQRYLQSRHWYDFRLAIFVLSGGACVGCGDVADEVHHLHYRTKGNESACDVVPLCRSCHAKEHSDAMKFRIK